MQETWAKVDTYYQSLYALENKHLRETRQACEEEKLPDIAVSPCQGKLLNMLVTITHAKRVLEIGTLGAYSTIWMAQALPENGKITSLEYEEEYVQIARQNVKNANLESVIEIRQGMATDTLEKMIKEGFEPFDFIFIDADKPNNPAYFDLCLKLSKSGTLILADNVIRQGEIINTESSDESVRGVQKFNKMVANNKNVTATTLQTVGIKGYDGFSLIHVEAT